VPRAKQRTPELRERVLGAALTILDQEGVAALTARKVADSAGTSVAGVYELFGDKAGLVREVFFEGFRRLARHLRDGARSGDPRSDLIGLVQSFRSFALANPILAQVMFSRAFREFNPQPADLRAADTVRGFFVDGVRECVRAGQLAGDETDIAHGLLALAQGLTVQETGGWLGTSTASINRRWTLAIQAILDGLTPT
jgi:AcrR family transcriptional regulator